MWHDGSGGDIQDQGTQLVGIGLFLAAYQLGYMVSCIFLFVACIYWLQAFKFQPIYHVMVHIKYVSDHSRILMRFESGLYILYYIMLKILNDTLYQISINVIYILYIIQSLSFFSPIRLIKRETGIILSIVCIHTMSIFSSYISMRLDCIAFQRCITYVAHVTSRAILAST